MQRDAPIQLDQIGLPPHLFKYSDDKSWRGPCPVCGGHRRFVIFTDHEWPLWNGYCDECGHIIKAWLKIIMPISDEQRQRAQQHAAEMERRRHEERQAKLAQFTASELWEAFHRKLTAEHRQQWNAWGVPDEWQDYLDLGFVADKTFRDDSGELRHSAAYTIPYSHYCPDAPNLRKFLTLQYRLFDAPNPADRYRFEYGLPATFYMTVPTDPIGDVVIICEGAKKGIVTRIHLSESTVLAVPSKGSWGGIIEAVRGCGRVYVLLDPDAVVQAVKMAREIGKAARVVRLNHKVDDLVLHYGMLRGHFDNALRWARKV